jgi:hypothetical protein
MAASGNAIPSVAWSRSFAAAVLEPWALAAIAIFLTAGHTTFELLSAPGYPTLFGDDFHLGEQILPWQQLFDFHKIPYVDFAPVHGLMPFLTGALNEFFFDGTLANLNTSFSILVAIASAITLCLACRVSGVVLGLALCFLLAPFDRLLFLAPALLLLVDARLWARPAIWFGTWCLVTLFMLGYNAAIGSAFAGGTAPFAILALFQMYKAGPDAWRKLIVPAIVALRCHCHAACPRSPYRIPVLPDRQRRYQHGGPCDAARARF